MAIGAVLDVTSHVLVYCLWLTMHASCPENADVRFRVVFCANHIVYAVLDSAVSVATGKSEIQPFAS